MSSKENSIEALLRSVPTNEWIVRRVLVGDWYDGIRSGICWLERPACEFYFSVVEERYNPDGCDERDFSVAELNAGTCAEMELMESALKPDEAAEAWHSLERRARMTELRLELLDSMGHKWKWADAPKQTPN